MLHLLTVHIYCTSRSPQRSHATWVYRRSLSWSLHQPLPTSLRPNLRKSLGFYHRLIFDEKLFKLSKLNWIRHLCVFNLLFLTEKLGNVESINLHSFTTSSKPKCLDPSPFTQQQAPWAVNANPNLAADLDVAHAFAPGARVVLYLFSVEHG